MGCTTKKSEEVQCVCVCVTSSSGILVLCMVVLFLARPHSAIVGLMPLTDIGKRNKQLKKQASLCCRSQGKEGIWGEVKHQLVAGRQGRSRRRPPFEPYADWLLPAPTMLPLLHNSTSRDRRRHGIAGTRINNYPLPESRARPGCTGTGYRLGVNSSATYCTRARGSGPPDLIPAPAPARGHAPVRRWPGAITSNPRFIVTAPSTSDADLEED